MQRKCVIEETVDFETESAAKQEAEKRGGVLFAQRMVGAMYRAENGVAMRVSAIGWAHGFRLTISTVRHEQPTVFGGVWLCYACGARKTLSASEAAA